MSAPKPKQVHRLRRLLGLKRVLALNIALFVLVAWGFSGELLRNREMQDEVDRLQAQADELAAKNSELAEFGKRLSDPQVLEREARLKLNLRKPGEEVVVVKGASGESKNVTITREYGDQEGVDTESNFRKWWRYFFP